MLEEEGSKETLLQKEGSKETLLERRVVRRHC